MMHLIDKLRPGALVLDLGAGPGSFGSSRADIAVVRLDLEPPQGRKPGAWVAADAAQMPFADGVFDLVVSNHSLEHFLGLETTLREVGRIIRPGGAFYVAVPDAGTLTDRIYRWLGKGGGHVNAFRSPEQVAKLVLTLTGLPHRGTRSLFSSLSFLNAHNFVSRPPRKIALFAFGNESFLAALVWLLRWLDRHFGTGLSRYGWEFYFGSAEPRAGEDWINVCVRCGSGYSEDFLREQGAIPAVPRGLSWYRCPTCGGMNLLSR